MADNSRPRGREKNVTGQGAGVHRRGEGLGTGPVGSGSGGGASSGRGQGGGQRSGGTRGGLPLIVLLLVALLGGGGGLSSLLGGGGTGSGSGSGYSQGSSQPASQTTQNWGVQEGYAPSSGDSNFNYYQSLFGGNGSLSTGWTDGTSTQTGAQTALDTSVATGSREKYTQIKGNGQDQVTLMVYMCGTDLESRSGMATSDMQEMATADFGDNINILIYTGGCAGWKIRGISTSVNQIYQLQNGNLHLLVKDTGAKNKAMTDPSNLSYFIQYCAKNYPADRYELILWDHGGGSVSGYGYDEKYKSSGAMSLSGINTALKNGGVKFDFIGFDACLMATMENALMLDKYADYLIASEETEPGVGWYYTDWLTALGKNTSMPTVEIGQKIVDGFVSTCARKCQGQKTTLSVVDLAELACTAKPHFKAFSTSVSQLITDKQYKQVANARNQTREFAATTRIDQVDLVHLAENMGTDEGKALAQAIRGAVKYNRTSSNMTNAYGLSIYFPLRNRAYVDKASQTYSDIGIDDSYSKCIRQFASLQVSGQAVTGGDSVASPYSSLFGNYADYMTGYGSSGAGNSSYGSGSGGSGAGSAYGSYSSGDELIAQLLGSFLGGDYSSLGGLSGGSSFLSDRALSDEDMVSYLADNYFDGSQLYWTEENGQYKIKITPEQWSLVHGLDMNLFYDDGEGYVDLGLDNVYDFDEEGNLIADTGETWVSINGQPVAYYHLDTVDDGEYYVITGRVPALLNGEYVNLILQFSSDDPKGSIVGAVYDYKEGETETVAKSLTELVPGDKLDFLCDFYSYDGQYQDSYMLGEQQTVTDNMVISDTILGEGKSRVTYKFTDIYEQSYWSEALEF